MSPRPRVCKDRPCAACAPVVVGQVGHAGDLRAHSRGWRSRSSPPYAFRHDSIVYEEHLPWREAEFTNTAVAVSGRMFGLNDHGILVDETDVPVPRLVCAPSWRAPSA